MSNVFKIASHAPAFDTIVIGAGHAGLATSHLLKQRRIPHIVLERGRIGESWRSQRWDSFAVNSPNALNGLPSAPYRGDQPNGFFTRDELVQSFERYVRDGELPVRTGTEVTAVERGRGDFVVRTKCRFGVERNLRARSVVVASGIMQQPKLPQVAAKIPQQITQLHTGDYRNPAALPSGSVVVVGSGQSGSQIAEDLIQAGRRVYLCTSKVARLPRRYRGRDILAWLWDSGFLHETRAEQADPSIFRAAQPQVSGVGRHGHTLSLQGLAVDGVTLLGRLVDVEQQTLLLGDDLNEHIRFADEKSAMFKQHVDSHIAQQGIVAPAPDPDPADQPCRSPVASPSRLDLADAGVGTIIWCTGFTADFSWLRFPVLDAGRPVHERGVTATPGLYLVGFPWLYKRKSGIICGVEEDASHV
ncbi:MAG: NAD(P)/FAD-dependent oxidoreductase, partial [Pseudomonadota bacterium]